MGDKRVAQNNGTAAYFTDQQLDKQVQLFININKFQINIKSQNLSLNVRYIFSSEATL